jgi:hypothetical protein
MRRTTLGALALAGLVGSVADGPGWAAGEQPTLTVAVYLPTTLTDGAQRLATGDKLGQELCQKLGCKPVARNFARYADFAAAVKEGSVDLGLVDGWVLGSTPDLPLPVALGQLGTESARRWALVTGPGVRGGRALSLSGKSVALTRALGSNEGRFAREVLFEGDFDPEKRYKLTSVPTIESALRTLEIGTAEAAFVPAQHVPAKAKVVYQSPAVPVAGVVVFKKDKWATAVSGALAGVSAAPFDRFVPTSGQEVSDMRRVIQSGQPPKRMILSPPPALGFDGRGLVTFKGVDAVLPYFPDKLSIPTETPDD